MVDVQNRPDTRNISIDQVGVSDLRYPITVLDRHRGRQDTVANITMTVNLPHHFKGTHMSRFIAVLGEYREDIHIKNFEHILNEIKRTLEAQSAHMEVEFPYFIEKTAPVTGSAGLMEYRCTLMGMVGARREFKVGVKVPIQTLCPCSKEISDFGAHNQRGIVTVVVRYEKFFWMEDLIEIIEGCGSSQVYPLLKRPDEKYVTEEAYANPRFVEDVVRQAAHLLSGRSEFSWFSVEAENIESIHNHSAYAYIESEQPHGR